MELAGVIGMGLPQEGIRPDLLKYIFVKGPEASEQKTAKSSFWVFNQSHEMAIPATATAEPHGQHVSAIPDEVVVPETDSAELNEQPVAAAPGDTGAELSTAKQRPITHFFSPCSSAPHGSDPTRRVSKPSFITPCPSVTLAEVPAVFQVQANCVVDHYLDPTHPLFERNVLKSSSELPSLESDSSPVEVDLDVPLPKLPDAATKKETKKRFRQYSLPSFAAIWHDRMVSGSSKDETLLASPAQGSEWSFVASPQLSKGNVPFDSYSSPPGHAASDAVSVGPTEDAEPDNAEADIEKFWIEKDEERLAVINDMEKTMAGLKRELANTVTAFQMVSEANYKLQAEVEKKTTNLSQIEEDMNELLHDLNVADMNNEKLEKDLANSRIDCKHHSDRAEEALTSMEAEPSGRAMAKLVRAKAKAESGVITKQREMESEMEFLESQVKERCDSVAHLTETLSKVADSDRWKDIQGEMEGLRTRADKHPEELQAAWDECAKWKKEHDIVLEKHENVLVEQASLKEDLQSVKELDLSAMRELKQRAAVSERALQKCLKQVFERMVRCSLCLESEGYLPFDRKHRAIYERVSELTGRDYQQRLIDFYDDGEHDIQGEFHFGGEGVENDDDDDGTFFSNNGAQPGNQDPDLYGNDQEHTQDSSFAPMPGTTEEGSVTGAATQQPASPNLESSNGPAFLAPVFQSSDLPTPAINNGPNVGKPFDISFSKNPPPSLFAKFTAGSETKSGEGSTSSKHLKVPKLAKAATSSTAGKGHSQGIWSNTSFATGESNPFAPSTTSAADLGTKSNTASPIFTSFPTPQPAEAKTSASEDPETEQGTKGKEAPREAATQATIAPTQLPHFNSGGKGSPFAFTGSSPFVPSQPRAAEIFPCGKQSPPSMTVQPEKKAFENGVPKRENSEADMSQIEAPTENAPKEETPKNNTNPVVNPLKVSPAQEKNLKTGKPRAPKNSPSPSPSPTPNRSQKRAAKKAEAEARNAKAQAKKRVEMVMMIR